MIHKAKKSLGQNFLKSEQALRMMCEAGAITDTDIILEIGPGKGALTRVLLQKAHTVFAVEKDQDLVQLLKEKFASEIQTGKLILIQDDILDFNPNLSLKGKDYKVIANIPYNITGAIFKKFLEEEKQPERMVLLVQKEVAKRIVAGDKKESILSLSVKAYGIPKYVLKVPKRFFSPAPKVDSGIVAITEISRKNFKAKKAEKLFFDVLHASFAHKRKVLRKNLEDILSKEHIVSLFETLHIKDTARAEDLPLPLWIAITNYIQDIDLQ
jgi:16S rRNA (adenine1518-N6/adenine1519-N6)-dimethyltransferase